MAGLKRYEFTLHHMAEAYATMEEDPNGDYHDHEDVIELLKDILPYLKDKGSECSVGELFAYERVRDVVRWTIGEES